MASTLILVRHGQSTWNLENRFTGWTDIGLTNEGIKQAKQAGHLLQAHNIDINLAYTSVLKRAIHTLWHILDVMNLTWVPFKQDWRLNERHYGALQGLNKTETAQKYGDDQVLVWRRSYDIRPPALNKNDAYSERNDRRYINLMPEQIPLTECLKDTVARVLPFWHEIVAPLLQENKNVLLVAHGNSIRALVKYLDNISDSDIVNLEIPNGAPLVYKLNTKLQVLQYSLLE